jgi:ribonucleoside-diphosphate reductase alpha chain
MFTKIKKRTGDIVSFDRTKIGTAMKKAFFAQGVNVSDSDLSDMSDLVVADVEGKVREEDVPSVELIQDAVERTLMEKGHFTVAKAYILYRHEHAKVREEERKEVLQKIEENELSVTKRDGKTETFSLDKIR